LIRLYVETRNPVDYEVMIEPIVAITSANHRKRS
jgi:hypothetical protein